MTINERNLLSQHVGQVFTNKMNSGSGKGNPCHDPNNGEFC